MVKEDTKLFCYALIMIFPQVNNQKVAAKALCDYQASIEDTKSNIQMRMSLPEGKKVEEWKRQGVLGALMIGW